jgi:parvulin-like peptidyl-prolyl isomerase
VHPSAFLVFALLAAPVTKAQAPAEKGDVAEKAAAQKTSRIIERIVAVVGNDIILLSDLETALDQLVQAQMQAGQVIGEAKKALLRREVLDTLISEKLIEQEIAKLHVDVTDEEVDRVVDNMMAANNLDKKRFKQALAQQGLSLPEYREGIKKQLLKVKIIQLKVKNRVHISDQDVKSTWAQKKTRAQTDFKIRARHILFLVPPGSDSGKDKAAKKKAEAALVRARGGEDFTTLAKELSEGPSGKNGGALGVFGRGEMVPAFEKAAFSARVGDVVGPVKTPFGWHLILVEERVAQKSRPLDVVQEDLRQQLYEAEVERAFRQYLEEIRARTWIDIRLDSPKAR